jgi:hypothetical protein
MRLLSLFFCSLVALSTSLADPVVSVTSSCSYAICTGGVQAGNALGYNVQSLDVYTSATIEPNLVPYPTSGQGLDTFYVAVDVMLQTYGSGTGVLVVDPLYTLSYLQNYPEVLETSITADVNNSTDPQITCGGLPMGVSSGNDLICSGEALIPIMLGSEVQLVLKESNAPGFALPASSTLSADLSVWTEDAAGNTSPVALASLAPEPADVCILGLCVLAGLVQLQRRRRARTCPRPDARPALFKGSRLA